MFTGIIFILLVFSVIIGSFFIGINYYSNGEAYGDGKKRKIGKRVMLLPFAILTSYFLFFYLFQKISFKPKQDDLVGKYEISEVSTINIEKTEFSKFYLELKKNGEFYFNNKPGIDICEIGKYKFDNSADKSEISFDCGYTISYAKIVSGLNSFEIEFIIGDPDSGESVRFKKIDN